MTRSHKILGFLFVMIVGVYGCAKGPAGGSEKNPSLESKVQRLEEDFRAAASARDQFKQKLLAAEERQSQLQKQLDQDRASAVAERDALKAEVKARTTERDTLATQYDGFRKGLKELIGQAENALANPSAATPAVAGAPNPTPTETGSALRN
jgi:chromosome segregation ATPase